MATWEKNLLKLLATDPLRQGDKNTLEVKRWRARLRAKGWTSVAAEGAFDAKLATATRAAQTAAGVKPDGIVGPITWKAVGKLKREKRPILKPTVLWKPKVIDCRHGRNGYPRHVSRVWDERDVARIKYVLGHYTGNSVPFMSDAKFHVFSDYLAVGGAPAIAYGIGVDKAGRILVFNDPDEITWHCDGGFNSDTFGIVYLGGEEGPNALQKKALKWLVEQLRNGTFKPPNDTRPWPRMPRATTSHQHVNSTSCPGAKGEAFYRGLGWFDPSPTH